MTGSDASLPSSFVQTRKAALRAAFVHIKSFYDGTACPGCCGTVEAVAAAASFNIR